MALLITGQRTESYAAAARVLGGGFDIRLWPNVGALSEIRYALAWHPPPGVLASLPNLELIISVGAGVDHLLKQPDLPDVPIVRFVDPDLTARMSEYVTLHTLLHHRRMSELLEAKARAEWAYLPEPAAADLTVGIMGLGELGRAAANALQPFGYRLLGWSRSAHDIPDVECLAGNDMLGGFLGQTDILVVLLPLTPDTAGILNTRLIGQLRQNGPLPGPVIINAGRGGLQVEADIIAALEAGTLYATSLDVFEAEPLPASSPLWSHPRVIITPHNAAESKPRAIARYALRQIATHRKGAPLEHLVDRKRGY